MSEFVETEQKQKRKPPGLLILDEAVECEPLSEFVNQLDAVFNALLDEKGVPQMNIASKHIPWAEVAHGIAEYRDDYNVILVLRCVSARDIPWKLKDLQALLPGVRRSTLEYCCVFVKEVVDVTPEDMQNYWVRDAEFAGLVFVRFFDLPVKTESYPVHLKRLADRLATYVQPREFGEMSRGPLHLVRKQRYLLVLIVRHERMALPDEFTDLIREKVQPFVRSRKLEFRQVEMKKSEIMAEIQRDDAYLDHDVMFVFQFWMEPDQTRVRRCAELFEKEVPDCVRRMEESSMFFEMLPEKGTPTMLSLNSVCFRLRTTEDGSQRLSISSDGLYAFIRLLRSFRSNALVNALFKERVVLSGLLATSLHGKERTEFSDFNEEGVYDPQIYLHVKSFLREKKHVKS